MEFFAPSFPIHQQDRRVTSLNSNGKHFHSISAYLPPTFTVSHTSGMIEAKPRLGKDEVKRLEREFKKNPKPSTQTKKIFAEEMNVDLPRINNWFQNRRAKRKQENMLKDEAAQIPKTLSNSTSASAGVFPHGQGEYSKNYQIISENTLSATCPGSNDSPYMPKLMEPLSTNVESFHNSAMPLRNQSPMAHDAYFLHDSAVCNPSALPLDSGDSNITKYSENIPFECSHNFSNGNLQVTPELSSNLQSASGILSDQIPTTTSPLQAYLNSNTLHSFTSISSQLQGCEPKLSMSPKSCFSQSKEDSIHIKFKDNALSAESTDNEFPTKVNDYETSIYEPDYQGKILDLPPAPSNIPFRSRPPMNIALRRKKVQQRPAALTAHTLNSRPAAGPCTVSHVEGSYLYAKSPSGLPMRRIVSAGGNRAVASGRVQKYGFDVSPRSPLNIDSFENIGTFMEYNFHNIYNEPSLTGLSSLSGSLPPPTPSDVNFAQSDGMRTTTSPVDAPPNYLFNYDVTNCLIPIDEMNHNLGSFGSNESRPLDKSPLQSWANFSDFEEKNCTYKPIDEPSYLSIQDALNHGCQLSEPLFYDSTSQPATPAVTSPYKSNFTFGHPLHLNESVGYSCQPENSYLLNESIYNLGKTKNKGTREKKLFQFSHTTPADFFEK